MKDFKIIEIMELFDEDEVIPASEMQRPQSALEKEAFEDFNKRNPKAGGGMLVQPGFGGTRQGYARPKGSVSKAGAKYEKRMKVKNYLTNLPDNSSISVLDLADDLEVSRSLIDNILKEKQFKNKKFNLLRRTGSLTNEQFATEYKNFQKSDFFKTGADEEFADYLNDLGFKPQEGEGKFTPGNVGSRRRTLNIKSVATKAVALTDKQILKEAKRLKIKNIKSLSSSELRNKVITARAKEKTKEKLKEDLEFKEEQRKKQKIRMDRFIKKRMSTEEGKAKLLAQRRKDKRTEYRLKGLDPLATNADEAIWRDSVMTANKNVDGKGRFSIESGYSKSMSAKDYYGNKIKIKDNQTGKIFNYNNFKNYVNKNAGSFGLKNYDEAVKSYRQKFFINDKPNLRTSINYALIPNYNEGMTTSAYTIQHDFGRQNNPLKTSLAFYDDNLDEYRIRTDFENAWAASKKSKTPLADRKKAFNVFKKDLANLNIQSVPSMVTRERFFGKGLDLTDILKTAKKEGATLPRGLLKEAAEFDKQLLNDIETKLAAFSSNPKCRASFGKKEGGRINYATGPANLSECAISGKNRLEKVIKGGVKLGTQEGALATQILRAGKSLGGAFTLSGLFGPAAIAFTAAAEAGIVGYDMLTTGKTFKETIGDSLFNYALGEKTKIDPDKELIKRFGKKDNQGNFLIKGMTDDKLLGIQQVLDQTNTLNTILKQNLKVEDLADQVKFQNLQPKDTFMLPDDEMLQADTAMRTRQSLEDEQQKLNKILKDYRTPMSVDTGDLGDSVGLSMEDTIIGNMASDKFFKQKQDLAEAVRDAEIQKLESKGPVFMGKVFPKFEAGRQEDLLNLRGNNPFGLAGGGIAKLAGIDEGPQTVSMNPDSQGLRSLKNRVKNM